VTETPEWARPSRVEAEREAAEDAWAASQQPRFNEEGSNMMENHGDVWSATVDAGAWEADVWRETTTTAVLVVKKADDGLEVLRERVTPEPDHDDVRMWQTMIVDAIDHYYAQRGEQ